MARRWRQSISSLILMLAAAVMLAGLAGAQTADEADKLNAEVVRLYDAGKYTEAIGFAQRIVALREKALGLEHADVGKAVHKLAELYERQGRAIDAEPLYKRAIAIFEKVLGPKDANVGATLSFLAELYRAQGRYDEAEPLFSRSLTIAEEALGPEHPDVGTALNNLAGLYKALGRYTEAETLYWRSLTIAEKALGTTHAFVGTILNNLGVLFEALGRYPESGALHKRALAVREASLRLNHPDIAQSLQNLAALYHSEGRYAEAEPLFRRSLDVWEQALGPNHPLVAAALSNLGSLYQEMVRFAEAEALYHRAISIFGTVARGQNSAVASTLINLSTLLVDQGRYAEAEGYYIASLEALEKVLGSEHPSFAVVLGNLGGLYVRQHRYAEAERLLKRCLALSINALGTLHPAVATAHSDLAGLYYGLGQFAKAEQFARRALAIREAAMTPLHPDIAVALNNLAGIAVAQRDYALAAELWQRAVTIVLRRPKIRLAFGSDGSTRTEAQQKGHYSSSLVKATWRLAPNGYRARVEMFETAQWSRGSEAASSLAQMAVRFSGESQELAALVREQQDLVAEWRASDKRLILIKSEPPARRNAAAEAALANRLGAIDVRLAAIDATLARDFPDYTALANPKPTSITDVQAALRDDEALVLFLDTDARFKPLPEETFVWVVTKREVHWLRSEFGTAALQREVVALRCGLDITSWDNPADGPDDTATDKIQKAAQRAKAETCLKELKAPPKPDAAGRMILPFDAARAHALYKGILGKAADLTKGKHLIVVPSGALTTLPFQVLITQPPKSTDLADVRWLVRDHAITVLPSVSSLKGLRNTGKSRAAPKPMIGFANPLLDGPQEDPRHGLWFKTQAARASDQKGCAVTPLQRPAALRTSRRSTSPMAQWAALAELRHLRRLSPLPETADEVCEVARVVGADTAEMRIGSRATETEVKRLSVSGELTKYRILHFATHGTLAGQLSGTREPGLILTPPVISTAADDGYLSGSEIAGLKLNAEWVILSACNTAGGAGSGEAAEALSGLASVFFYAGARALLVSHWEVDSDAAVKLVTSSVRALSAEPEIGRAEALRRAMLAVMADNSRPKDSMPAWHPAVWAPFVVVGEGGR